MNCDGIVLGGDLNSDFSRHSGIVNNINIFMNNHDLQSLWNIFNVDYTYRHTDGVSTSTIDHFIVSNSVFNKCCSGGVTHSVHNTSNHSAINMSLEMNTFVPHNLERDKTVTSKIAWYKASSHYINFYKCNVDSKLPDVIPSENTSNCGNTLCDNDDHKSELDAYFESLIYVLLDSSTHIPHTCAQHESTRIPSWNELVKPYREDAIFWKWLHGEVG